MAAALGNVDPRDNWKVHFRDTMRGGKFLNDWRMAELHAKQAPDRVRELEEWGAVFDRTQGRPDQPAQLRRPPLPAPRARRRSHRPRADPHRCRTTASTRASTSTWSARARAAARTAARIAGVLALLARDRPLRVFTAKAVILAHRRRRQGVAGHVELVGVHRRRHRAGLRRRRRADGHGVHPVPPDRHGVAAVGARHPRHRGRARRRRHPEEQQGRALHVQLHPGEVRRRRPPTRSRRPTAGSTGDKTARRPPELLTRDEVARAITAEVKAGRGSPHGGVFLDIASRRRADFIKRKLPSMYHQFKELAEVDITKEPMEVGPTLHYFMGGIRVDADTQMTTRARACSPRGECARGHARRQPARRQLAVRPDRVRQARRRRRARLHRGARRDARGRTTTQIDGGVRSARPTSLNRETGANPYLLHEQLQRGRWTKRRRHRPREGRAGDGDRRARGAQGTRRRR